MRRTRGTVFFSEELVRWLLKDRLILKEYSPPTITSVKADDETVEFRYSWAWTLYAKSREEVPHA